MKKSKLTNENTPTVVLICLIIMATSFCSKNNKDKTVYSNSNNQNYEWLAEDSVRAKLKDPDSALFSQVVVKGKMICGLVNSKNSFGGYSGNQRFISGGNVSGTFLESEVIKEDFQRFWILYCS